MASFTQAVSNLKLEELKQMMLTDEAVDVSTAARAIYKEVIRLLELPYYEVPGWKEIENP